MIVVCTVHTTFHKFQSTVRTKWQSLLCGGLATLQKLRKMLSEVTLAWYDYGGGQSLNEGILVALFEVTSPFEYVGLGLPSGSVVNTECRAVSAVCVSLCPPLRVWAV